MLKYIGNGNFLAGVPARDLTEEEVIQFGGRGRLVRSGLWAPPVSPPTPLRPGKAAGGEEAPPVSPPFSASKLARNRGEAAAEKRGGKLNKAVIPGEDKG